MGFRMRMIHPDIWADEDLGSLSVYHRLLFIGLFSHSDDEGIVKANPAFLKASIFPYDRISKKRVREIRDQLIDYLAGVQLYEENGKEYIKLLNWNRYQKLKKPTPSVYPKPKYKKKAVPFATRRAIAQRHGLTPPVRGWMGPHTEKEVPCHYCGKMGKIVWMTKSWVYFRDLELDHIIPERLGGTGEADNIVLSCRSCNRKRHMGIIKSEPSKNQVGTPIEEKRIEGNRKEEEDMASPKKETPTPPKKATPQKTNPDVKQFIDYAFETYKTKFGQKLPISAKKDGQIIKGLLESGPDPYSLDELKRLWKHFLGMELLIDKKQVAPSIGAFRGFLPKIIERYHASHRDKSRW